MNNYNINEIVFCSVYGISEIINIDDSFYQLKPINNTMTLKLPKNSINAMRDLSHKDKYTDVLQILNKQPLSNGKKWNWNQKNRENQDLLKNGTIEAMCDILKNLFHGKGLLKLSFGEKKTFNQCLKLLGSEFSYVLGKPSIEIETELLNALKSSH